RFSPGRSRQWPCSFDRSLNTTPEGVCSIVRPMHETSPKVFLLARPSIDLDGMRAYLQDVGGESWLERRLDESEGRPNGGELIVEFGGRACYRSWEPGLNPNVSKVRTDQREYFANILRSAHGSVLEHANYSFALRNVSRVMTHELVRHRAGSAFSQESLRYVRLADIGLRVPPPRSDRPEHGHRLDGQRPHAAPRDRDAHGRGSRGGAAPRVRHDRADDAGRGARSVPGLHPPGRRLLGARAPQGLTRRRAASQLSRS